MSGEALVIGGDIRGVQTALDLADSGIKVTLVEPLSALHTNGADSADKSWWRDNPESLRLIPKLLQASNHPNIKVLTNASVSKIRGSWGDYRVNVVQQPRYVSVDKCTSCSRCERACPVNVIPPSGNTKDGHKAIHGPDFGLKSAPSTYIVDKRGVPPCTAACPAGINVQGYVALISKGKIDEALDLITEAVAFPRVLGRVCTHPCEDACTRSQVDKAVSICALKRYAADNSSPRASLRRAQETDIQIDQAHPRVAIIGAGPAGLTAARDLARLGHRSTVFEALPAPGGMIAFGMPRFRLPREVRQADIDDIVRLGIEIRTSTPIGKDLTIPELQQQGYEAILIAVGAHRNQRLGIPGEGLEGVINSIAFLQAFNLKQPVTVGKKVVVIGGGYTGIDSARTAVRLHCERVLVVDRYSKEMLTANPDEITEAEEEGVEFDYLVAALRIVGRDSKVEGVEFHRMRLGRPDYQGRRHAIPVEGTEFFVEADTVVVATGQRPVLAFLVGDTTLTEGGKHIIVNPLTLATTAPGIFAAGDAARPGAPMINAIAEGRQAAISIDRYLHGEDLAANRSLGKVKPIEVNLDEVYVPPVERQPLPRLKYEFRTGNFEEVKLGYNARTAIKEAQRCLNCATCCECLECERACELSAIDHCMTPTQIQLEADAIAIGKNLADQLWDSEVIGLSTRRSGIYQIPSSPEGVLYPASAIASRIMVDMAKRDISEKECSRFSQQAPVMDTLETDIDSSPNTISPGELRVGIFVCNCGGSIREVIDIPDMVAYYQGVDDVVLSRQVEYACTDEADSEIINLVRQHGLTHVVLAACSCCNLDQICFSCSDRRVKCKSNLLSTQMRDNVYYEFVNIREHCAWVHTHQAEAATAKAKKLVNAGLARTRESQPLSRKTINIDRSVLVVGGGLSGLRAATNLASQGFQTALIRKYASYEERNKEVEAVRNRLEKELLSQGTTVLSRAELISIAGQPGQYRASVSQNGKLRQFAIGAIIFDLSAGLNNQTHSLITEKTELPPFILKTIDDWNHPLVEWQPGMEPASSQPPGIFLCGTGQAAANVTEALMQGGAAASKAAVLLNRGTIEIAQTCASVDQPRCRGCGTCETVCVFGAIALMERIPGVFYAQVDDGLCQGCGLCVAHCPSGALSQNGYSDRQISASLEAILS